VLRPTILRDEDFGHWFDAEQGRRSIPPSVVASAFLLALREGCSDREAEQRMRYDLRWKWGAGAGDERSRLRPQQSGAVRSLWKAWKKRLNSHVSPGSRTPPASRPEPARTLVAARPPDNPENPFAARPPMQSQ
jgi:hypothetical protein